MVTTALDGHVNVWDVRTYKRLQDYIAPSKHCIQSLDISQKGQLAMGFGPYTQVNGIPDACSDSVKIWANYAHQKASAPYMKFELNGKSSISCVRFCPYEDILGIGHSSGFHSIVCP